MAHLHMETSWTFAVTNREMRLILLSLSGRLPVNEEKDAELLGDKLTQARVSTTRQLLSQMEKLEYNLHTKIDNEAVRSV